MARKKIWAYAIDNKEEYIKNKETNKERLFFIWEVIKMRKENPKELSLLTFMSTQSNKDKRAELTPVKKTKTAFFRYKSDSTTFTESHDSDSEYISHETAILVLSEMKKINLQDKDKIYEIEFDNIKKDDLQIKFEDGSIYYPDLVGFFSKPIELARKWGGKVAIEVKVTHKCSYEKIKDFQDHNIPIIEVSLSDKMRLNSELNNTDIDEDEMERYYNFLKSKFNNIVYMKILSDPIMLNEHKFIINKKNETIIKAIKEIESFKGQLAKETEKKELFESTIKEMKQEIFKLKESIDNTKHLNNSLLTQLDNEKNRANSFNEKINELKLKDYESMNFLERFKRLFR